MVSCVTDFYFFCSSGGIQDRKITRETLKEISVPQECPHPHMLSLETLTHPREGGCLGCWWVQPVVQNDVKLEMFFSLVDMVRLSWGWYGTCSRLHTVCSVLWFWMCVLYVKRRLCLCVAILKKKKIGEQRKSRPTRTPWPCWFPWSERRQGKRHKMKQDKNRSDLNRSHVNATVQNQ